MFVTHRSRTFLQLFYVKRKAGAFFYTALERLLQLTAAATSLENAEKLLFAFELQSTLDNSNPR